MESLHLPQDLYWDVKMEPNSPQGELISIINPEEAWLLEDNFAKDILLPQDEIDKISNSLSPASDEELLYEFEIDFDSKSEQWIDGKTNVQELVDYSESLIPLQSCPTQAVKVQSPLEIFMELEKIYDVSELTQLTPPQTPPQEGNNDVKEIFDMIAKQSLPPTLSGSQMYNDVNNIIIPAMSPSTISDYSSDASAIDPPMSPPDIALEMQIVDEILRTRAKELPDDWTDDDDDNESQHSLSSSLSSSCGSEISGSLSLSSSSNDVNDDEWSPSSTIISSSKPNKVPGKISNEKSQKKRTRPYGRPVEDKKIRKKEQNKNAATRYRQKKKQEMEEILDEERQLTVRNEELTKQVNDIEREVKYLKQLIKEFHKSKKSNK